MTDPFNSYRSGLESPATRCVEIVPNDANDLDDVVRSLWIGTGGDIALLAADDTVSVTFTVPDGTILPVRARRVLATGTTATGIVGLL